MEVDALGQKYSALFEEWRLADHDACVAQHNWRVVADQAAALHRIYVEKQRSVTELAEVLKVTVTDDLQQLAALNSQETKP